MNPSHTLNPGPDRFSLRRILTHYSGETCALYGHGCHACVSGACLSVWKLFLLLTASHTAEIVQVS